MSGQTTPESVVREFWRLMVSNDFASVATVLADAFVLDWPQSGERIRGAATFARMNADYPAHGPWRFRINRLVAAGDTVVTQASVTDGVQSGEAISFFTIVDGRIATIVEILARAVRCTRAPPAPHGADRLSVAPGPARTHDDAPP